MPAARSIEFDPETGAMYVSLADEVVVASTEEQGYVLDKAEDGTVVGIEFLTPTPEALRSAGERFGFLDFLAEIARASRPAIGSCTVRSRTAVVDLTGTPPTQSRPHVPVRPLEVA